MNTKLQELPGDKVSFQSLKAFKLRKNTRAGHYVSACLVCPTFPKLMTYPWKEAAKDTWSCQDSHLSQGLPNYWLGRNHNQILCLPGIQEIGRYARVGPGAYGQRNKAEGGSGESLGGNRKEAGWREGTAPASHFGVQTPRGWPWTSEVACCVFTTSLPLT